MCPSERSWWAGSQQPDVTVPVPQIRVHGAPLHMLRLLVGGEMRLRQNVRVHAENFVTHGTVSGDRLTRADTTFYLGGLVCYRWPGCLLRVDRVVR